MEVLWSSGYSDVMFRQVEGKNVNNRCFIIFIPLLILISCRSGPSDLETILVQELKYPSLVDISLEYLPKIESRQSQIRLMNEAAAALQQKNYPDLSESLLSAAEEYSRLGFKGSPLIDLFLDLSRSYLQTGITSRSIELLEQALNLSDEIESPQAKGNIVREIVTLCFEIGADAVPLLRSAIHRMYIIEDLDLRSELLLDTARKYQETDEGQRSNVLLQQAIPAIESMEEIFTKARAYALLGRRLIDEGEHRIAEIYSEKAILLLNKLVPESFATDEARDDEARDRILGQTLIYLSQSGYANEALGFSGGIFAPRLHLGALLETAGAFYQEGQFLQSDLVFQRIFTALERSDDPTLIISMLLNVAIAYKDLENTATGILYLNATENYFPSIPDDFQKYSLLLETARIHTSFGNLEEALTLVDRIGDEYTRSQAYIIIAKEHLEKTAPSRDADKAGESLRAILARAVEINTESDFRSDSIFSEAAIMYAQLQDISQALKNALLIDDIITRARSLLAIFQQSEDSAEYEAVIDQYRSRLSP